MSVEHACAIWIPTFLFVLLLTIMQWNGKLPSVDSIQALAAVTNSKGGNILVLGTMSLIFFFTAMRLTYWCLDRMIDGKLTADNAVVMMGLTFVTGSAFGGSFSSMLKAMSGENAKTVLSTEEGSTVRASVIAPSESNATSQEKP